MAKNVRVYFYVDMDDNTKSAFAVVPEGKDLRNKESIKEMTNELQAIGFGNGAVCQHIAESLIYTGQAEVTCTMGRYQFGNESSIML